MTNYTNHYASTIYQSLTTYNGNLSGSLSESLSASLSGSLAKTLSEDLSENLLIFYHSRCRHLCLS